MIIPAINILSASTFSGVKWYKKAFLFNLDFVLRPASRLLYPVGISVDPKQVVIGRDGWLYLGDQHQHTLTVNRRSPTENDHAVGKKIGAAAQAWNAYFSGKGIKLFKIMVGPNKDTIYSEHLPAWAKPLSLTVTDALFAGTGKKLFIDLRQPMLAAKENQPLALYYKTDTHWNAVGAGVAFRAFAQQVAMDDPELRWPPVAAYALDHVDPRAGGDLAKFLRLNEELTDSEPIVRASNPPIETTQFDFHTEKIVYRGGSPVVESPTKPLLVKSESALNNKRVLWLRDSFGGAMSPLMAATFSDVLHLHWSDGLRSPENLIQLIDKFKPDYVFMTVVERSSREKVFTVHPPSMLHQKGNDVKN
jgi:alginate O-acetyltransferase complex protein AlgJ